MAAILRQKAKLINLTAFETIFEFLGLNFNAPELSTIVNPLAYKAIGLDFSLWARTGSSITAPPSAVPSSATSSKPKLKLPGYKKQIQRAHLEQFTTLLETSRYRAFNWKVGLGEGSSSKKDKNHGTSALGGSHGVGHGVGLVRRILFALQMGWYSANNTPDLKGNAPDDSEGEDEDMTQHLVDALGAALRAPGGFGKEDIKAVIAYLAANLHMGESFFVTCLPSGVVVLQSSFCMWGPCADCQIPADGPGGNESGDIAEDAVEKRNGNSLQVPYGEDQVHAEGSTTPQSAFSRISFAFSFGNVAKPTAREKAEKVLELLVDILSSSPHVQSPQPHLPANQGLYQKFTTALPLTRILLLLLGEHPTPLTATLILRLIALGISFSPSFSRKFELVSGWSLLKVVLPSTKVWDVQVNRAAWDVLLGRIEDGESAASSLATTPISAGARREKQRQKHKSTEVSCTHILPTIISALQTGLIAVADGCKISDDDQGQYCAPVSTPDNADITLGIVY